MQRIALVSVSAAASSDSRLQVLQRQLCAAAATGDGRHAPSCRVVAWDDVAASEGAAIRELEDADAILFVADILTDPRSKDLGRILDLVAEFRPKPDTHLVLLHGRPPPYRGAFPWLRDPRIGGWHHVGPAAESDIARLVRRTLGRAVGLVLSGGGARGFAHIGVLRAFDEAAIPVDFIAGASMGAIIAAQHAMGIDLDGMLAEIRRSYLQPRRIRDFAIPYVAIQSGLGTNAELKRMFGGTRIEDLRTPYFAVSSNLSTAETVVHATGRLWHVARASCSVPGLLPPVRSRRGFLVDGGLLDNLPVSAMRERCSGRIVASDVSVSVEFQKLPAVAPHRRSFSKLRPPRRMPGIRQILMRTAQLASVRDSRKAGVPADLYLRPPVDDVGMTDFHRLEEIVERGADHARAQLAGWRS